MSRYLNQRLSRLAPYVPGEQPRDRGYIKLNTNESPYPPSSGVLAAVSEQRVSDLRLYCDPTCAALRDGLAEGYGLKPENVFLGNGSDEVLNFAFLAFGGRGVAFPDITYGFYKVFAQLHGLSAEIIPLKPDFTVDVDALHGRNQLVVIANPNAPTGLALSLAEIEGIVQSNPDSVVVVDEAYVDFGAESCLPLTQKYDNLLCVQTFSKSRSMAGARLGFALGNRALIGDLERIKYSTNPYNINSLTQAAGLAAIEEEAYYRRNCEKIIKTRQKVAAALKQMEFTVLNSQANFLFAGTPRIGGKALYERLRQRGILVRHFDQPRIGDFIRITIGSAWQMEQFLAQVGEVLEEIS